MQKNAEKEEKIKTIEKIALEWVKKNDGKKAINSYDSPRISSEIADCSMCLTFDQYSYCSLGCIYCFAYFFKSNNPAMQKNGVVLKKINLPKMLKTMSGGYPDDEFYINFYQNKFILHWGGLGDPFCNFENSNMTGYDLIKELGEMNYPTLFSLKGGAILNKKYISLFEKYSKQGNFAFQFSIINFDDNIANRIEVGVPSSSARIKAMEIYSQMGYWTVLRLRPFIVGVSDLSLNKLLENGKKAGMSAISTEFFALDSRSNEGMKGRYDLLAAATGIEGGAKGLFKYYSKLSPKNRGGYLRLNRLIKEIHVKKMYQFCLQNDVLFACSDPDFKELNMSGSCCGIPDNHPGINKGLNNWSREQLTEHLRLARKEYHTSGRLMKLKFETVYNKKQAKYLSQNAGNHPCVVNLSQGGRGTLTYEKILNETWNNLKSPGNPYNYFDGKLSPSEIENGNIIYEYSPSEYEQRWSEEGINLAK